MPSPGQISMQQARGRLVACVAAALVVAAVVAMTFSSADQAPASDAPRSISHGEYYASVPADATGDELRAAIHAVVARHTPLDYADTWSALAKTDADADAPGRVVLFYTGWSRPAEHRDADGRLLWNREHVWAQSRGSFGRRRGPGSDLHMLRPTDESTNGARGNLAFDDGGEQYIDPDGPTENKRDADSWEPRDAVKGDVARILFYAAIRYEDRAMDLELTDEAMTQGDSRPLHGRLSALLRWHQADPPDDRERRRNDEVQRLQGNRNPFVDRPEWVERLWNAQRLD